MVPAVSSLHILMASLTGLDQGWAVVWWWQSWCIRGNNEHWPLCSQVQLLGWCPHQYPGCHNYITITKPIVTSVTVMGLISTGNLW